MNKRLALLTLLPLLFGSVTRAAELELLHVSFDPTRELFAEYNTLFAKNWQTSHGDSVVVRQSHGGSAKQARAVGDGLEADVVSLALAYDINAISEARLLDSNWQDKLPNHSVPFSSTVVFLVRKDNPKQIHDWPDLIKQGVSVITPNPKTSGGARWNYLAAWGYALKQGGSEAAAQEFVRQLYRHVKVLDSGARGATTSFTERQLGDVLIAWESEAQLVLEKGDNANNYQIVYPSVSILAAPPVAVVDRVAHKHGTTELAHAYLQQLYSPEGQRIAARHHYRPSDPAIFKEFAQQFPSLPLFTVEQLEGDWNKAQKKHFARGGLFDQLYQYGG